MMAAIWTPKELSKALASARPAAPREAGVRWGDLRRAFGVKVQ